MIRFVFNFTITLVLLLLAAFVLRMASHPGTEYDIFDLIKGKKLEGRTAVAFPVLGQSGSASVRGKQINVNDFEVLTKVNSALADLTEAVVPSVVSIDTTTTVNVQRVIPTDPYGLFGYRQNQQYEKPGLGSGAIVSEEGHIVTNNHVVAGVDAIQVTTHDGGKFRAELIGSDPNADIAILKIVKPKGSESLRFRPLPFGDSDRVRVGEMALAIGNPFGLSETVTRGIISAKQRQLSDGANEYFQVDAVINPGNSGGPLVNIRGEIIGVNVAIFTGQQDVKVWQGIGLAIPSNEAREIFDAIVHNRPLERGFLGVGLADLRNHNGALVIDVAEGSPAEAAGIRKNDVIFGFEGKKIKGAEDLISRIRRKKRGESVPIKIIREGVEVVLEPEFVSKSDTNSLKLSSNIKENGQSIAQALGIKVQDLTDQYRRALRLEPGTPGIIISEVEPGSQAESRFRPGDLVIMINQDAITSVGKFYDVLGALPKDKSSIMILSRNGNRFAAILNP